jgi:hypothetical protein
MSDLSDFNKAIYFFKYFVESVNDYNFCNRKWPDDTILSEEEEGDYYNYFKEKIKLGVATTFYSITSGIHKKQLDEIFKEWKESTKTTFRYNPLISFPLRLFVSIENLRVEDLKEILNTTKQERLKKIISIWKEEEVQWQLIEIWKYLEGKDKKKLLRWAYSQRKIVGVNDSEKIFFNALKVKYSTLFK